MINMHIKLLILLGLMFSLSIESVSFAEVDFAPDENGVTVDDQDDEENVADPVVDNPTPSIVETSFQG